MQNNPDQFSSKIGFVLAAAGSAVGIGNLVGFPVAAAKNGGGAFLLLYIFFVIAICLPLILAELSLGRATNQNPLGAFRQVSRNNKAWVLAGALSLITPFMIAVFYSVLTVWLLGYFLLVLMGQLDQLATPVYFGGFITSPWIFACLAAVICMVIVVLKGGVRDGIEKASRVLMPMLFIMLIGLAVFVLTLPNATAGLKFYFTPQLDRITWSVVNGALSQAFFSLSLGMGILITYGSYLRKQDNLVHRHWRGTVGRLDDPARNFRHLPQHQPQRTERFFGGLNLLVFPEYFHGHGTEIRICHVQPHRSHILPVGVCGRHYLAGVDY
jgi:neurotransmitter:Na+ symporter, NSS family